MHVLYFYMYTGSNFDYINNHDDSKANPFDLSHITIVRSKSKQISDHTES